MVDINIILLLVDSIAIFFQGFSFRRRHVLTMLVSSFIILLISGLSIIFNGIVSYVDILSNVDKYDAAITLAYVLFLWISGYIIGGFQKVPFQKVPSYIKVAKVKLDRGEIKFEKEKERN